MDKNQKKEATKDLLELQASMEVGDMRIRILARQEALEMFGNLINYFLQERQKDENRKLSDVELSAIQAGVNAEVKKTAEIVDQLKEILQGK